MVNMEIAGRRRSSSGTYNPLADASLNQTGLDAWICVCQDGVSYYASPSLTNPASRHCRFDQEITAEKEGDWLKDKDTGFYLPYLDQDGNRLFKNARLVLMERATSESEGDLTRQTSRASQGSKGSNLSGKRSNNSRGSSSDGITRRQSFRWVDAEGVSRRIAGDSDELDGVKLRPEVWICVSETEVQYRTSMLLEATSGKFCKAGAKITAVKEDDWLKVFEVKEVFDAMNAAEMIGRRSLKSAKKVTVSDTGLYLPFQKDGQRLFKNEKVVLWEAAQSGQPIPSSSDDKGGCSLM